MLKNLLKDSFIYTLATVVSKGIGFFLLPIITLYIAPDAYGALDLYLVFISLVGVSVGMELSQGLARYTATASIEEKQKLVSTTVWFTLFTYSIFIVFLLFFNEKINALLISEGKFNNVFTIIIFLLLFIKMDNILKSQLRWDLKVKQFAGVSILYSFVFAISVYILLSKYNMGITGYFIGQFIATITSLLIVIFLNKHYLKFLFSKTAFQKLFQFSYPLVLSSLTIVAATYIDRIIIKELLDLTELGLYGIAFRFASLGGFLLVGIRGALLPIIYREYEKPNTKEKLRDFFYLFYTGMAALLIFLSFFSQELLYILTESSYHAAYSVIPILTAAVLFNGMYIFAVGVSIAKKTKVFVYVGIFSLISNIVLNYIFIPIYGIQGAAMATCITGVCSFIIYMFFSQKNYQVNYNFLKISIVALFLFLIYFITPMIFDSSIKGLNANVIFQKSLLTIFLSLGLAYFILGKKILSGKIL